MPDEPSNRADVKADRQKVERVLAEIFASVPPPPRGPVDAGRGGDDDGGMEERLRKVEEAVVRIDTTLGQLATKADLGDVKGQIHAASLDIIKWVVGTAVGLGVAGIAVMTFVLNNAIPKQPSPPQSISAPGPAPAAPAPSPASPAPSK